MQSLYTQFKQEGFVFPDYRNSNMQILREMAAGSNKRTGSKSKKIFMVVDGLGYNLLKRVMPKLPGNPELSSISTIFPSTTPAVLASIESGKPPSEHGIIGWQVYVKEIGSIIMPFRDSMAISKSFRLSNIGLAPILPEPSMLIRMSRKKKVLIQYSEFINKPYNEIIPNASHRSHATHVDMFLSIKREIAKGSTDFIYAYYDMIDHLQHMYGESADESKHAVISFFKDMERILIPSILKSDYNLVITADHGTIEGSRKIKIRSDDKVMDYLIMPPYGDSRTRYLYVQNGKEEKFEKYFDRKYGRYALLVRSDNAIKSGLFGEKRVKGKIRARFGTHVMIMKGNYTFEYAYPFPAFKRKADALGYHSGMSEEEMRVPLIVY